MRDQDVPGYIEQLGIPGILDTHAHFMPDALLKRIWTYFDQAGPLLGRQWPIRYKWTQEARVAHLRDMGVVGYTCLSYAHRPGMAEWLTDWGLEFAAETSGVIASGTFFPEPGVDAYVAAALDRGCRVFKIHLQVGDFDPLDATLVPVWGQLADAGVPVVVHAGSGPMPGRFTGAARFGQVLAAHPGLRAIIAHMGMPDERDFFELLDEFPELMLDTTMVGTDFMESIHPFDVGLLPRIRDLGLAGRVVFGSDYPNIPYPYAHQVEVLRRWDLGDEWLAAVLWGNGAAIFGVS
ncbi:MAG: amidohydrolase family protein [Candidatus Nanopelagicales bacterium]|nr:amidohydrolase family protein [Candidatus Nanopelagicales bacterium]